MTEITGGVDSVRAAITKANSTAVRTPVASETTQDTHEDAVADPETTSWWRRVVGLIWDSVEGDPEAGDMFQKLNTFLFSYICLGYFIKYLGQQNYSNAFVSGMQEDLKLYGKERNWLVTYFNLGIIIGTVPSQMIQLKYIRPSVWIPFCEVAWSIFVMGMAGAKNVETTLDSQSMPGARSMSTWEELSLN